MTNVFMIFNPNSKGPYYKKSQFHFGIFKLSVLIKYINNIKYRRLNLKKDPADE